MCLLNPVKGKNMRFPLEGQCIFVPMNVSRSNQCGGIKLFDNIAHVVDDPNFCNKTFGEHFSSLSLPCITLPLLLPSSVLISLYPTKYSFPSNRRLYRSPILLHKAISNPPTLRTTRIGRMGDDKFHAIPISPCQHSQQTYHCLLSREKKASCTEGPGPPSC